MLRFAIAEDVPADRELLEGCLTRYLAEHGLEGWIHSFSSGEELLEDYPSGADAVFLDIEMAGMNGMETARQLRRLDRDVPLLFVTNMVQFALEGYEVDAADFIVKPVEYASFALRMDRLMRRLDREKERFLLVKQGSRTLRCDVREILYIESLNTKTILHRLTGEPVVCTEPLYTMEKSLEGGFFRCHNAFLVNLDHVEALHAGEVVLHGERLPISKYRKKEFLAALANHRGRML